MRYVTIIIYLSSLLIHDNGVYKSVVLIQLSINATGNEKYYRVLM